MTGWTAIVPLKLGTDQKSRLSQHLSAQARRELGMAMATHVITQLREVDAITEVIVLTQGAIDQWPVRRVADKGRGLNAELQDAATSVAGGVLVIHGDLPLVAAPDIQAMLAKAEHCGCAIAPDRHGTGTNALALRTLPGGFRFAFGQGSFALHQQRLPAELAIMTNHGLNIDIDTKDDLDAAIAWGFDPGAGKVLR